MFEYYNNKRYLLLDLRNSTWQGFQIRSRTDSDGATISVVVDQPSKVDYRAQSGNFDPTQFNHLGSVDI
jgi:hypothetical protein